MITGIKYQQIPADTNVIESYDLYPDKKDSENGIIYGWFAVYFQIEDEIYEQRIRAVSLNEAIGAFLASQIYMSYDDILEHCEI